MLLKRTVNDFASKQKYYWYVLLYSAKSGRATDSERALKLRLSAVPWSIANGDGNRRETNKSKLMDVTDPKGNENSAQAPSVSVSDFIIDFIALARTLTVIPKKFENLIWKIMKILPVGCTTLYDMADVKSPSNRRKGSKGVLLQKSVFSNVPREFQESFKNSDDKSSLIFMVYRKV